MQTLVATSEITRQMVKESPDFCPMKPLEYSRFLVISLGTGSHDTVSKYNALEASKWGILSWLFHKGATHLIDCYIKSNADMVDYHNCVVFQALHSEDNYLRVDVSFPSLYCFFFFSPEISNTIELISFITKSTYVDFTTRSYY